MALILPKGIVVNTSEIEGQIERINAEPLDPAEIANFWKVYTTTKRRLLDPTAERLENYWWRIWGSRRRELNGATVARLFAYISDGESFVPLRSHANRDEGNSPLNRAARLGPGATSATALHHPSPSRPSPTSSSNASKDPVVMPHPILKKTRGPSTTGPRPTARFISPHESEAEAEVEAGTTTISSPTMSVSPNSHVVVRPPSPDSQNLTTDKKANVAKKSGRVASTAARKSRPKISRRQSSQSSADSAAKVETGHANQSLVDRPPPTLSEDLSGKGKVTRFQEELSPEHVTAELPKRRQPSKPGPKRTSHGKLREESTPDVASEAGLSSRQRSKENLQDPAEGVTEEEVELQRTLLEEANARVQGARGAQEQEHDTSGIRLKSRASLAPTLAAAEGQLDLSDSKSTSTTNPPPKKTQTTTDKGKETDNNNNNNNSTADEVQFAKRPVPSISSLNPAAVVRVSDGDGPLSRSKSQLTLLLEKDRARSRSGEHSSRNDKGGSG